MNSKQLRALIAAQDALREAWLATEDRELATRIRATGVEVTDYITAITGPKKEDVLCS